MFDDFIAIGLFVRDFDKAFDFYKNIFGLRVKTENLQNKFAEFQLGNITLGLMTKDTSSKLFNAKYFESEIKEKQSFTITVKVNSVDKLFTELKERGITIISGPKIMPWGWKVMCIKDIEGYIWEICETYKS